jgi:hypothetical protein
LRVWPWNSIAPRACAAALVLALSNAAVGDPPAAAGGATSSGTSATDAQTPVPSGGMFSSLKQALREDFKREVVRGHFDVGSPPDTHRFYCLVDAKTGKPEANGVGGDPYVRPDGMTGINNGAVGPVSCAKAEQQGILVTAGYVLKVTPQSLPSATSDASVSPPPPPPPPPSPGPSPPASSRPAAEPSRNAQTSEKIDVAGVRLGMSPEQVRAVLKSRMLSEYFESTESLDNADGAPRANAGGRYVNLIAAWTPVSSGAAGDTAGADGESYEIMFTPVPGKERALAIVHSMAYSSAHAIQASALQSGLLAKYGAYSGPGELTDSPTWRFQSNGTVLTGDTCSRRGVFGGLGSIEPRMPTPHNLALKTTPEEFRFQIDRCGVAIVTEDHSTGNHDASGQDHPVMQFTVTAYSPSIAFDGATTAAQLIQSSGSSSAKSKAPSRDQLTPNL